MTTSSAASDTAWAKVSALTLRPRVSRSGADSSQRMSPSRRSTAIGTIPAFSSNVIRIGWSSGPSSPRVASTNAVPTLGCPANGTSTAGVKIRTRRVLPFSGGKTKEVSAKLNSRAICCIRLSDSPVAAGSTASWLPPKRVAVKTSQVR